MNNETLNLFEKRKIFLRDLKKLDSSEFTRSKTLKIFFGVDTKNFFTIVIFRFAKTKLLRKDNEILNEICQKIETKFDTVVKKRILFYSSNICKKALKDLNDSGWKCYDFV